MTLSENPPGNPRQERSGPRERPLSADLVEECPPHYWVIAHGWQDCKKCHAHQEVPSFNARPPVFRSRRVLPPQADSKAP